MEWTRILALVVAGLLVLVPVAFIWYICVGGICAAVRGRKSVLSEKTCAVNADCPPGYMCINGRCVPQEV